MAKWIPAPNRVGWYYCSACGGMIPHKGKMPVAVINRYCRKCGIKMGE